MSSPSPLLGRCSSGCADQNLNPALNPSMWAVCQHSSPSLFQNLDRHAVLLLRSVEIGADGGH
jgi:hypothetical protein